MSRLAATIATRGWCCDCMALRTANGGARGARGNQHRLRMARRRPDGRLGGCGLVEEASAPELERQQRPELQIDVTPAAMQTEQSLDIAGVEEPPLPAA